MQRTFLTLCSAALQRMTALVAPVAAMTTTGTFQADADAEIRWDASAGRNYGTAQILLIRHTIDPWGTGTHNRGLVGFNLSSIPEGSTIESATLHGYMSARVGNREVAVYRVTSAWTESGVTWNNAPSNTTQPTNVTNPGPVANVWVDWNVTRDAQTYVLGAPNYGWPLVLNESPSPGADQRVQLNSRQHSNSAQRPYLEVTYSTAIFTPILTTIEASPATANLAASTTQQFVATAKDQLDNEMTGVTFIWSSSNETGLFTALDADMATVIAAAEDATGTAQATVSVPLSDLTITRMHTMPPGWNFVSTPKRLADGQNTIAIFDGVDTADHSVLYYNGTSLWEALSREEVLLPLDGLWIYANGTTYEIPLAFAAGSHSPPPTKYLDAGWNAIGFSDTFPEPAVTTLRSVEPAWTTLFGWKAGEQEYDVSIIRGATGRHGEMRELVPFQGYWLYMNDADILAAIGA